MIKTFSIIGFVGTIFAFVLVNNITGYELQSFHLWFIIPIGALFVGAGAVSGIYYGHLKSNKPLGKKEYLIGTILGLLALQGIFYVSYLTTYVTPDNEINSWFNGDHISTYEIDGEQITFSKWMELSQSSGESQVFFRGRPVGEGVETGETVNKFNFYLNFLGAAVGGFFTLLALGSKRFCKKCKKYIKDRELFKFGIDEHDEIAQKLNASVSNPKELFSLIGRKFEIGKANAYCQVDLEYCPTCFDSDLAVKVMKQDSQGNFEEVQKLRQTLKLDNQVGEIIMAELSAGILGKQKCFVCKATINLRSNFCLQCGAKVINKIAIGEKDLPADTICSNCSEPLEPDAKFCRKCGTKVSLGTK
jgi:ribosomal protein L40E